MALSSEPFTRSRRSTQPPAARSDAELAHAEGALHDLARELLRVPLVGGGKALHLRALDLKRRLLARHDAAPGEVPEPLSNELEELARLGRAARTLRAI
jgi:hypothetical protein